MARIPPNQNDAWCLADDEQDVRSWEVRAPEGTLGRIDQVIVNTETKHVETIVLADGSRYAMRTLRLEDGVAYLSSSAEPTADSMIDHAPAPEHERAHDRPGDLDGSHRRAHSAI